MDSLFAAVWSTDAGAGAGADAGAAPTPDPDRMRAEIAGAVAGPMADLGVARYVVNVPDAQVAGAMIDVRVAPRRLVAAVRARVDGGRARDRRDRGGDVPDRCRHGSRSALRRPRATRRG